MKRLRSPKDVEGQPLKSGGPFVTRKDLAKLERLIRMTQAELAEGLLAIQTQVGKVATEQSDRFDALSQTIAELEAIIAAGADATPAVVAALDAVKTSLQALDDTIPDAPPPPTE